MIRARLNTGEVVELRKDCGCLDEIHSGPHWLHMNDFRRRQNEGAIRSAIDRAEKSGDIIAIMQAQALIHKVGAEEIARLEEKERMMRHAGIEEIIRG
jgi:hypothetical protein